MQPLRPGDPPVVGEFRLLGRLGSGGMGVVYLGVTRSGRPVAVKVVRPEIAADPVFRGRFAREVAAARQVGGFWTASVVAADATAAAPWLATEYVPGPSLADAVTRAGPLPVAAVRVVAARLAEALAAIHAAGLVHRDLKPANVVLAPDGPKVIDFGIARAYATETAGHTAVIGTPGYMSPEQIQGEPLSPASDIFSLGSTLVYALRGAGPFHTGAPAGIVFRVVAQPPDLTGVPAPLYQLVAWCLAKEPARRPTTDQLLAELAPAASGLLDGYGGWRPPSPDPVAAQLVAAPPAPAEPVTEPLALPDPPPPPVPAPSPPVAAARDPALAGPALAGPAPIGPAPIGAAPAGPALAGPALARHLQPGERPYGQWRQHRVRLVQVLAAGAGGTVLLGLLAVVAIGPMRAAWFGTIPIALGIVVILWTLWMVADWRGTRLVLTDRRVLVLTGALRRRVAYLPLSQVAGVSCTQSWLGRMLHFGTLTLVPGGRLPAAARPPAAWEVPYLPAPDTLRHRIAAATRQPD